MGQSRRARHTTPCRTTDNLGNWGCHGGTVGAECDSQVLGPVEAWGDDGQAVRVGSAGERFVLAALLLSAGRMVRPELGLVEFRR